MTLLSDMPNDARIWIYQSSRALSQEEIDKVNALSTSFINQWTAHGKSLRAAMELKHGRFLILAADEHAAAASGCSIDKSVAFVRELEDMFNIRLLDRMQVAFRTADNQIETMPFTEVKKRVKAGEMPTDTMMFNNLVTSMEDFQTKWEIPINASWLVQA
jgi:hypothetical protein